MYVKALIFVLGSALVIVTVMFGFVKNEASDLRVELTVALGKVNVDTEALAKEADVERGYAEALAKAVRALMDDGQTLIVREVHGGKIEIGASEQQISLAAQGYPKVTIWTPFADAEVSGQDGGYHQDDTALRQQVAARVD